MNRKRLTKSEGDVLVHVCVCAYLEKSDKHGWSVCIAFKDNEGRTGRRCSIRSVRRKMEDGGHTTRYGDAGQNFNWKNDHDDDDEVKEDGRRAKIMTKFKVKGSRRFECRFLLSLSIGKMFRVERTKMKKKNEMCKEENGEDEEQY